MLRAIFGVMPRPPAEFSALTTTNVKSCCSRSAARQAISVRRPMLPTTSPTNRMLTCDAAACGSAILWPEWEGLREGERGRFERQPADRAGAGTGRRAGAGRKADAAADARAALGAARAAAACDR